MERPITAEEMNKIDENSARLGVPRFLLMENAGHGIANHVEEKFGNLSGKRILALAGSGNNGGDAFVAARHLAGYGAKIVVILLSSPKDIKTEEARLNWKALEKMVKTVQLHSVNSREELLLLRQEFRRASVIIDGIFGTGIRGTIRDPHASAIELINSSRAYKIAVDVPSGLDPTTGLVQDKCVRADVTITFHRLKKGLIGREEFTGRVLVEPIGVPPEADIF